MALVKQLMGLSIPAITAKGIVGFTADNLAATGQAAPESLNVYRTVVAGGACYLQSNLTPGDMQVIVNYGAHSLLVYPPIGGSINNAPVNKPITIPVGYSASFQLITGTSFRVEMNVPTSLMGEVSPLDYGCVGDGVTDDTVAYLAMLTTLAAANSNATIRHPRGYTFAVNLSGANSIVASGITIIGQAPLGSVTVPFNGIATDFVPYNPALPCIQIGNDTQVVRGVKLQNLGIRATGPNGIGAVGLKVAGGAWETLYDSFYIDGFTSQGLRIEGNVNYPVSYNCFSNFNITSNYATGDALSTFFNSGANGWVTAQYFANGSLQGNSSGYCINNDGCILTLANMWIQPGTTPTINLLATNSTPGLVCSGVQMDSQNSAQVYVNIPTTNDGIFLSSFITGGFGMNGYVQRADSTTFAINTSFQLPYQARVNWPFIEGNAIFVDSLNPTSTGIAMYGSSGSLWMNAPSNLRLEPTGRVTTRGSTDISRLVALTAGGNADASLTFCNQALGIYVGSGAPTISAPQGSLYLRSDGSSTSTRAYINTNGATGWAAITTAS